MKEDGSKVNEHRFAAGPSTGRGSLDDGRIAVDFGRGPCKQSLQLIESLLMSGSGNNVEEYKLAIGLREVTCVQNMP